MNPSSTILSDVEITGTLTFSGELHFDGQLHDGDIIGETLVLGPKRRVQGNIQAAALTLHGSVTGDVLVTGRCELKGSASLVGSLTTNRLAMDEGATLIAGGLGRPEGLEQGFYVKPTIFMDVNNQMRIAREEVFGPVLTVIPYQHEDEAIAIANDTEYGLMTYFNTTDVAHAKQLARRVQSGRVLINTLKHDPLAPFGGFKHSGIGRENGTFGIEAFLEPKALIV